jgi:hypothetical protein
MHEEAHTAADSRFCEGLLMIFDARKADTFASFTTGKDRVVALAGAAGLREMAIELMFADLDVGASGMGGDG